MPKTKFLILFFVPMLMASCYHNPRSSKTMAGEYSKEQQDSLSFRHNHYYGHNYNFVVRADSLTLIRQLPEEKVGNFPTDSFVIRQGTRLVVADINILSTDTVDSVWVQLASDQTNIGWIHESELLPSVDPDDPISQFITVFSNKHLLYFLIVICLIGVGYLIRRLVKRNAYIVHFKDINSFYPTLLALTVASSATLYSTIQLFTPDAWRHFYFHPTLNPFTQPLLLMVFLSSVWSMLIIAIAAIDDTFRHLPLFDSILYLCGLMGVCAVNYIIFSISTLYYVGYLLLAAYFVFALWRYFLHNRTHYICGHCGERIKRKGRCPYCSAINR
ncbi:MAG: zinc ribbon domain-containing protein [Prevotella sp.]|nr:zinc ribbon domain-containing protein [Prevotella sp.]